MADLYSIEAEDYLEPDMAPEEPSGMSEDELLQLLQDEIRHASGQLDDETSKQRTDAMDYFYGRLPRPAERNGKVVKYRSAVVSTDVADAVENTLAEIMPAFSGDLPAYFPPMSAEDEDQADQESRVVNHVINGVGNGYVKLMTAVKDALLRRVGAIKVYWDTRRVPTYESHQKVPQELLPQILAPRTPEEQVDVIASTEEVVGVTMDPMSGVPVQQSVFDLEIRRTVLQESPKHEPVPVDELFVNQDHNSLNYDEARFIAHIRPIMATELVAMGYDADLVRTIATYHSDSEEQKSSRKRGTQEREYPGQHDASRYVLYAECYPLVDFDGDGLSERRKVCLGLSSVGGGGGVLLDNEPWDVQPFAVGAPYLGLFSWQGISLAEKLQNTQDVKTTLIRQALDANERAIMGRMGVLDRNRVNLDDAQSSYMGGLVRMKEAGAMFPIAEGNLPPSVFNLLEYMDKMRREKGGAAVDQAAQAIAMGGDTAHGLERMMSSIEQVNAMIAKTIAETLVVGLYKKMHALLRKHWQGVVQVQSGSSWLQQVPANWPQRDEAAVSVGLSVGERGRQAQNLSVIIQQQMQALEKGMDGVLVDLPRLHNALVDFGRMIGIASPEQYWVDPDSEEGQMAAQQKQQQQQQAEQQQAELVQSQMQIPVQMEQIKSQSSQAVADIRAQVEVLKQQLSNRQSTEAQFRDLALKYDQLRVELAKVNAEFDAQTVPDTLEDARSE